MTKLKNSRILDLLQKTPNSAKKADASLFDPSGSTPIAYDSSQSNAFTRKSIPPVPPPLLSYGENAAGKTGEGNPSGLPIQVTGSAKDMAMVFFFAD